MTSLKNTGAAMVAGGIVCVFVYAVALTANSLYNPVRLFVTPIRGDSGYYDPYREPPDYFMEFLTVVGVAGAIVAVVGVPTIVLGFKVEKQEEKEAREEYKRKYG